jgi:serine phosphatase RsbU (regulator of sigma subunit)
VSVSAEDVGPAAVAAALDSAQLAMLLETNTSAFIRLDRDWTLIYLNKQAEILLQRQREHLVGRNLWAEFAVGNEEFRQRYQQAIETGEEVTFEANLAPLGSWFEMRATPDATGLSVFFLDVSARRRAYDRLALVAEITRVLVGNRDVDAVASTLARALVPGLATWAMVSLYDEDGRLYEAAAAHGDPDRAPYIAELEAIHPQLISDLGIVAVATATGEPQLRTGLARHIKEGAANGRKLFQVLDRLGCDSALLLPLRARNRSLGVMSLFHDVGGGDLSADLETAAGLADRAGLALENAQLYSRQRRAAEVLQRSLLTPLPQPDHLHLVARYLPAADGSEVGGDWYDAFLQPSGATVLVIGDVVGHDIAAAAAMGQLRNLLRGTAYDGGYGPRQLLVRLDALIKGLGINTLATLLVGRLEQSPEQAVSGERTFRWSNAGHPPPMVRRATGEVDVLEPEPDLLLGLDETAERHEHIGTIKAGDTLLLYTDGLVERRERSLSVGIAELARTLAELEMTPLDRACDDLLSALLVHRPFDDVALLAMHAYSAALPRPAEAGPEHLPATDPADWAS